MAALAMEAMRDEEDLARAQLEADGPVAARLAALLVGLLRRKLDRVAGDRPIHELHRRLLAERPDVVRGYAERMTALVARLLAQGVERGELAVADVEGAASVVRDAATAFLHPALAPDVAALGPEGERRLVGTLLDAFRP